ncbi:threalose-6-phosphate phosphatase [Puccinia graminis f. sp. tritici]|uniref:Threalose-6-phosphate phosphatase n=1 Tax=Puccinia graminis f. sp. tritici TaxID=56615 RepID=A0A5B0LPW0_PUCGR|nr:threalose-6-phosphate phosphatase [Puccinia graminis f. sp. tritici]KAA1130524.1 threalose-6-phosphate phosphatase [Puccinia graminis f. sp. tritici]
MSDTTCYPNHKVSTKTLPQVGKTLKVFFLRFSFQPRNQWRMFLTTIAIAILLTGAFQPLRAALPHRVNGIVDTRSLTSSLQAADTQKLLRDHEDSPSSLIICDYDDVLTDPIKDKNKKYPRVIRALEQLAANRKNEVWIITGRPRGGLPDFIRNIPNLNLGEGRGTYIQTAAGTSKPELNLPEAINLKHEILRIVAPIVPADQLHFNEETYSVRFLCTREQANKILPVLDDRLRTEHKFKDYERSHVENVAQRYGSCYDAIMLSHRTAYDKGNLVNKLLEDRLTRENPIKFAICFGDERIDEPMHEAMTRRSFPAIFVGQTGQHVPRKTHASARMSSHQDVVEFLERMSGISQEGSKRNGSCFKFFKR